MFTNRERFLFSRLRSKYIYLIRYTKYVPRIIKLYYLQRFFHHLNFFWAIDKIFFSQQGINPFQISILLSVWSAYVLIFEVPSGAIADRWSRRWIMTIGSVFHTLSYLVWVFFSGFNWFLVGYLLRGTGSFLQSGTKEALVYDHLKQLKMESRYEKYNGYLWVVTSLAFLTASTFAGLLADKFSFTLVLILTVITNIISTVFTIMMPDAPKAKSTQELSYFHFIKDAFKTAKKNPLLVQAMFYTMTVLAVDGVLDEYDQLYVTSIGLPLAGLGIWWGLRMGSEMLAGLVAHKFKIFGAKKMLENVAVISFILLTASALINSIVMIGVLAVCFFCFSIAVILNEGRMQSLIASHQRATISSINALLKESVAIFLGLGFGYVANVVNPRAAMLVFAGLILFYLLGKNLIKKAYFKITN